MKTTKPLSKDATEVPPLHKVKMKVSDLVNDTDDLKREIKALNRENREQSIELRDVKKQNAQLRETCRMRNENADTHRDQIHHERNKFYEHVEGLEDHIAYLKQELIRRKALVESLTLQTREANDEKQAHEATARKLQKQNRDLHENLTECKDDLLRLQPPSQIPDSELAEQYSSLTQHISRWVDDETEDSQGMETCFEGLSKADDLPEPLKPYLTDEHIRLGKKSPNAQPFIIRFVVHRYLENFIFGNDVYLFGLDSRSIELFAGIERGMHELEPPRGKPPPLQSPSLPIQLIAPPLPLPTPPQTTKLTPPFRRNHHPPLAFRNPPRPLAHARIPLPTNAPSALSLAIPLQHPPPPPPSLPTSCRRLESAPRTSHPPSREAGNQHASLDRRLQDLEPGFC